MIRARRGTALPDAPGKDLLGHALHILEWMTTIILQWKDIGRPWIKLILSYESFIFLNNIFFSVNLIFILVCCHVQLLWAAKGHLYNIHIDAAQTRYQHNMFD